MRLITSFAIMLAISLLLQGCGRKGPLTMPVPDAQKSEQRAATPVITNAK